MNIFTSKEWFLCFLDMAQGCKNESKMKSSDLSSDFDRILLTPVTGNRQLLGRRKAFVLSRYTPPNILLIDFRETVSRRADEVTNGPKQLILSARCPCSFWFGLLYFLLLRIMTRVEEWKISITQRKSRRLLKFEKYNTGWLLRGACAHLECN